MTIRELKDSAWMDNKRCQITDVDLFFSKNYFETNIAKTICAQCVVIDECLEYSIVNRIEEGLWGGETEEIRKKIMVRIPKRRNSN